MYLHCDAVRAALPRRFFWHETTTIYRISIYFAHRMAADRSLLV
ncbi:hypothetical protein CAter10_3209 [Collimonas arenae]|nr:hypothetical protein CAter10_3209 [Collimonas arenae]